MRKNKCEILFSPGGLANPFVVPVVSMCQNLLPFTPREIIRYFPSYQFFRNVFLFFLQILTFRFSKSVIFPSKYSFFVVKNILGRINNPKVIYHGIDDKFKILEQNILDEPFLKKNIKGQINIVYISPLQLYKNHCQLINFFKHFYVSNDVNCILNLYGPTSRIASKSILPLINKYSEQGIPIKYHGALKQKNVPEILLDADIFIWASTCESFGIGLVEAMSVGVPILASEYPTTREILGESGLYFNIQQFKSFEIQLNRLIKSKELRFNLSEKAKIKSRGYNWEKASKDTFYSLNDLIT